MCGRTPVSASVFAGTDSFEEDDVRHFYRLRQCAALAAAMLFLGGIRASAQAPTPAAPDTMVARDTLAPAGAAVVLGADTLFFLTERLGSFTAAERADAISRRLAGLARDTNEDEVVLVEGEGAVDVTVGDVVVMSVTDADAASIGRTRALAAQEYGEAIEGALKAESARFSLQSIALGVLWTALATLALVLTFRVFNRTFPVIYRWISMKRAANTLPSIRLQKLELISGQRIGDALLFAAKATRVILTLIVLYFYVPLVLSFFPWTRRYSSELVGYVLDPLGIVVSGLVNYLPNLGFILVVVVVTYYALKLIKLVFEGIQSGTIQMPGFYDEWAEPTYKIVRFLVIAFSFIVIWPYLPRSDSEAFKGVAAFLGLLLTFGSASAIANIVGGVVMIYMRPFRNGDRVRIADTVGDVIEKTLLVTRVRTTKNVEITIPNAMVLGSHIINYSATAAHGGVILHTTVTIGYDVPWRLVHETLITAAREADGILAEPAPFVLQTALGDFSVAYELNAYTAEPNRMAGIYSRLHELIQDRFNEAGIEIMSPTFTAVRDGNQVTLPADYLPSSYEAPSFRVLGMPFGNKGGAQGGAPREGKSP